MRRKCASNIVIFDCSEIGKTAVELCEAHTGAGFGRKDTALYSVRLVTHVDVNREGIERALAVLREWQRRHRRREHEALADYFAPPKA